MRIICDYCLTEYDVDPPSGAPALGRRLKFRCGSCGRVVVGKPLQDTEDAQPAWPPVAGPLPPAMPRLQTEEAVDPASVAEDKGILLKQQGETYPIGSMAILQRWIVEGRVFREDLISTDGLHWEPVATHAELQVFFHLLQRLDTLEKTRPSQASPPPVSEETPLGSAYADDVSEELPDLPADDESADDDYSSEDYAPGILELDSPSVEIPDFAIEGGEAERVGWKPPEDAPSREMGDFVEESEAEDPYSELPPELQELARLAAAERARADADSGEVVTPVQAEEASETEVDEHDDGDIDLDEGVPGDDPADADEGSFDDGPPIDLGPLAATPGFDPLDAPSIDAPIDEPAEDDLRTFELESLSDPAAPSDADELATVLDAEAEEPAVDLPGLPPMPAPPVRMPPPPSDGLSIPSRPADFVEDAAPDELATIVELPRDGHEAREGASVSILGHGLDDDELSEDSEIGDDSPLRPPSQTLYPPLDGDLSDDDRSSVHDDAPPVVHLRSQAEPRPTLEPPDLDGPPPVTPRSDGTADGPSNVDVFPDAEEISDVFGNLGFGDDDEVDWAEQQRKQNLRYAFGAVLLALVFVAYLILSRQGTETVATTAEPEPVQPAAVEAPAEEPPEAEPVEDEEALADADLPEAEPAEALPEPEPAQPTVAPTPPEPESPRSQPVARPATELFDDEPAAASSPDRTPLSAATSPPPASEPEPEPEPEPVAVAPAPKPAPEPEIPSDNMSAADFEKAGWSAIESGNWDKARQEFVEAVFMSPGSADAHYGLAYAAQKQGDRNTAIRHYCQALQAGASDAGLQAEVNGLLKGLDGTCP